jgi:hypothetical protein
MDTDADEAAEQVGDNPVVQALARVGLVAYGAVHLLIAWTALRLAWGATGANSADTSGAMATLAQQPFGKVLLTSVAIGLLALALWQVSEVISGARDDPAVPRIRKKTTSGARAVIYASLGASAISVVFGSHSSASASEQQAASGVLAWPGGPVLVVAAGLITAGVGVGLMVKGVRVDISEEIDLPCVPAGARQVVIRLGQVGYVAKGVALAVVGGLLGYLAVTSDPHEVGLDGALKTILQQPFGKFLLTGVAVGFVAFGLYWILQSRFRRL